MSELKVKPPNRLRRPSYFHPVGENKSSCPVSDKVIEALMVQQQQGKLATSALGISYK